ncbi:hypothetical protein BV22DRAFT_888945 [Leucogyrophana mollusca]|uniref:Uncharacterized protein n=1 Tax=Leucogyrophana mollusca TaxID=85980 RepID=A0ACB8B0J3_9AGAM|nr:hypothetical protein BV22DRAFT_888945 [Leucogyrophana mollusca]
MHDIRERNEIKSRFLSLHLDSVVAFGKLVGCTFNQCVRSFNHTFTVASPPRDRNDPRCHAATLGGTPARTGAMWSELRRHMALGCLMFRGALLWPCSIRRVVDGIGLSHRSGEDLQVWITRGEGQLSQRFRPYTESFASHFDLGCFDHKLQRDMSVLERVGNLPASRTREIPRDQYRLSRLHARHPVVLGKLRQRRPSSLRADAMEDLVTRLHNRRSGP